MRPVKLNKQFIVQVEDPAWNQASSQVLGQVMYQVSNQILGQIWRQICVQTAHIIDETIKGSNEDD